MQQSGGSISGDGRRCWGTQHCLITTFVLVVYALKPKMGSTRRWITAGVLTILMGIALANLGLFFILAYRRAVDAGCLIPFSGLVLLVLGFLLWCVVHAPTHPVRARLARWKRLVIVGDTLASCVLAFPLTLMYCFGKTDYSRRADAIVVFGARAYADGTCSDALYDRVATACALYREGHAPLLIFSGGPGDGEIHETQAMERLARKLGVPAEDIVRDTQGLNTQSTVTNTGQLFRSRGLARVLAVSHFYHLPRVKMCYQRQRFDVFTVPARERYTLSQLPYLMAREVAAFWAYYLAPLRSV